MKKLLANAERLYRLLSEISDGRRTRSQNNQHHSLWNCWK